MKILYFHQYFNTPMMNGGTRSYEMARRLVNSGHEVHIITTWREDKKGGWFETKLDGINVHWLPVPYSNHMSYTQRIWAFLQYALKAGRKGKKIGGDIVFATSTPLTIAIPAKVTAKKLDVPIVFEVRDLWPELPIAIGAIKNPLLKYLARRLELFAYKNAKHIIALSPGMAKGVIQTGYPKNRVSIIPNSADLDVFSPSKEKAVAFRCKYPELGYSPIVLYAGTLGVINGVSYFAELAEKVNKLRSDVKFVVFGEGAEWSKVENISRDLGVLNKNFFMYESIPKLELASAFCAANLSVSLFIDLKPMEDNSSNKFFDALASGTPALINYGGWQNKLLDRHEAGLRLSRDVDKAALTIVNLLEQPDRVKALGINARALAKREFSRDLLALKLENVLCGALYEYSTE